MYLYPYPAIEPVREHTPVKRPLPFGHQAPGVDVYFHFLLALTQVAIVMKLSLVKKES